MTATNATGTNEEEAISVLAYEIWESEGRPQGRDKDHWRMAKELVREVPDPEAAAGDGARAIPAAAPGEAPDQAPDQARIRPAGRKNMKMAPATWSKTDEEVDESFPASDPPGNY